MNYTKEFIAEYTYANLEDFNTLQKSLYVYLQKTGHYLKDVELNKMDQEAREKIFKFSLKVWESKKDIFDQ